MSLSTEDKIAYGLRLKEEANEFVKKEEYKKACQRYRRVFGCVNGLINQDNAQMAQFAKKEDMLSEDQQKRVIELKATVYANLALCYLKMKEFERALECGEEAVKLDKKNIKALLRVGTACNELKLWEKGKEALMAARALDPQNSAVNKELLTWKAGYAKWSEEQKVKEKAAFGGKLL